MLISEKEYDFNIRKIFFAFSCTLEDQLSKQQLNQLIFECDKCNKKINITQETINYNYQKNTFYYKCDFCNQLHSVNNFEMK